MTTPKKPKLSPSQALLRSLNVAGGKTQKPATKTAKPIRSVPKKKAANQVVAAIESAQVEEPTASKGSSENLISVTYYPDQEKMVRLLARCIDDRKEEDGIESGMRGVSGSKVVRMSLRYLSELFVGNPEKALEYFKNNVRAPKGTRVKITGFFITSEDRQGVRRLLRDAEGYALDHNSSMRTNVSLAVRAGLMALGELMADDAGMKVLMRLSEEDDLVAQRRGE